MSADGQPNYMAMVLDPDDLEARLPAVRSSYLAAAPWPHVVVDGLFPEDLLDDVVAELATFDRSQMATAQHRTMVKRETPEVELVGPATRTVIDALAGPDFLRFVSGIVGIPDLLPDPERYWAGVHETPTGGFTMVHTDFERHPTTGLHHRSNVLLYLNRDWDEDWGGCLELWPPDMAAVGRTICPRFNSLVVFETHATTFHGLPEPVAAPDGRSRLSLAAYQYSPTPATVAPSTRMSKYVRRPGDHWSVALPNKWDVRNRIPVPVRRVVKSLRTGMRIGAR